MLSSPVTDLSPRWYFSAITVFKNEAANLEEWLAFGLLQGIEHFLLYDNRSSDNPRAVLQPWIEAGIVDLVDWPLHWKTGAQMRAFVDALGRLRALTRWAAFIDIDEFLFSPTGRTVADVLKGYESHAGVIVNWQCYGSSGHERRPAGLTIESYTRRATTDWARNRRVKTIVNPLLATGPRSAHLFDVLPNHSLVTEDFKPVKVVRNANGRRKLRHLAAWLPYLPFDPYSKTEPSIRQVSVSSLRINHYVTRSEEEMRLKYKDRDSLSRRDRLSHARYHNRNEVEDPVLVSKADEVRRVISKVRGQALASELKR